MVDNILKEQLVVAIVMWTQLVTAQAPYVQLVVAMVL